VRQDQCRSVLLCSHLFWLGDDEADFRDGKRVLECLQKCLRITDQVPDPKENVILFVEILNEYLYHFSHGNSAITVVFLNNLIELINTNIGSLKAGDDQITAYYNNTLQYIRLKQAKHESWREIKLDL
jgi:vacuolar protein sorting-associated protein 35